VDEKTGDLVQRVEDKRVPPCYDGTSEWSCLLSSSASLIADELTQSEEITSDKELGRAWEYPNPEKVQYIDKVAHTTCHQLSRLTVLRIDVLEEEVVELFALVYPNPGREVECRLGSICEWKPFGCHSVQ
jgi:hypothetical protein